ncbi:Tetratricopeptide repeat-containing protein [Flavobacteriaceae bacterium MAR_2010_188]|nr:Tetratricopeptide repeat-containing protein [Flavobacteriaceae bacterium MAR_2010_188]
MNSLRLPLTFFSSIFYVACCFLSGISFGQNSNDSLAYYSRLALNPQNAKDFLKAGFYFDKIYKESKSKKDKASAINALYYRASLEYKKGEYNHSEELAVEALSLLKDLEMSAFVSGSNKSFYNILGIIYTERGNRQKAIELYEKTLSFAESSLDSAVIYNNISLIHKKFNDTLAAQKELLKAYNLLPRIEDKLVKALVVDNLGLIKIDNDKANALVYMKDALTLREEVGDTSKIYTSYSHLATYYKKIGNYEESRLNAVKAYDLAKALNSASYKNDALGLLAGLSDDAYAKEYKLLNDSITSADQELSNSFALLKYDFSEYKRKALESELETEKQKNINLIFLGIVFIIVLTAIFLYFIVKNKHKKDKLQQIYKVESQISKKVHDEVANEMFHLMTKLQSQENINEDFIDDIDQLYLKTRDISKEYSLVESNLDYEENLNDLILRYNNTDTNVLANGISNINWKSLSAIKKATIYKVLQELLINMKKHSQASVVLLVFKTAPNMLTINYSDNGIGCQLKKGTGLNNIEQRIKSINGELVLSSNVGKGFKATIGMKN